MKELGKIVMIAGQIVVVVCVSAAQIIELGIVYKVGGLGAAIASIFLIPMTFLLVPWYAGLSLGNWLPLQLGWGGMIAGGILLAVGASMSGDEKKDA